MKLEKLYSLRTDFTIIGLTGRTGSGCTRIAKILADSSKSEIEKGLRNPSVFTDTVFERKYSICKSYLFYDENWQPYTIIKYTNVLLLYILKLYGGNYNKTKTLFSAHFKEERSENNDSFIRGIMIDIMTIDRNNGSLIYKLQSLPEFDSIREPQDLETLFSVFFSEEYSILCSDLFNALNKYGYYRKRVFLHWVSCNIRSTGDPIGDGAPDISNIYRIAQLINKLIKAHRLISKRKSNPTKIVIDSLRNSLEIMYFKERYSAFYMVASKDVMGNTRERIDTRLQSKIKDPILRKLAIDNILDLDEIEYKTKDFSKGLFSSPDVENCIQKSDFHVFNLKIDDLEKFAKNLWGNNINGFFTREEQLMKLVSLIQQPGLITPSSAERAMQIANTAKLNSGCISRKVGAVITDSSYFVKAVGWNDVAKGHTPCNLRSVTDFFEEKDALDVNVHYSNFEKGISLETTSFKYKGDTPGNFKDAMADYFKKSYNEKKEDLGGKNCSFCFKTVHNHYEGEANQVHTRSLHAEENAMLQITKLGGMASKEGFLFTTASPCELCSKKAYQLGVQKIFFIDPYPGIAVEQILHGGSPDNRPKLVPFSGAIGNAYHELYEPFMSYKDEISMTLELKPEKKLSKELTTVLRGVNDEEINTFLKETKLDDKQVIELVKKVIKEFSDK